MRYLSSHFITVQILLFSIILPLIAIPTPSLTPDITGSPTQIATRKRNRPGGPWWCGRRRGETFEDSLEKVPKPRWHKIVLARRIGSRFKNQDDPVIALEIWTVAIVDETRDSRRATLTFRTHLEEVHGANVWQARPRRRVVNVDSGFKVVLNPSVDHAILGRVEMTTRTKSQLVDTIDRMLNESGYSSKPNLLYLDQMLRVTRSEVERMYHLKAPKKNEQVTGMDFTGYVKWTDRFFPEMLRLNGTADGQIVDSKATEWEQLAYETYHEIFQLIESENLQTEIVHPDLMEWVKNLHDELLAIPTLSEAQMEELIKNIDSEHSAQSQIAHSISPDEKPH
ncbi:hypothetical protein F5878DRAFT_659224 [Lentinula raphanica]|uniref:Uncharacterized protein n=1 Tax=Lentinula raphanica TaxID=153919 RepID=A0AA38UGW8_9AGAR|nr:hypothetical protein F5878DRAFT_659224 [Lentinula raphanica]